MESGILPREAEAFSTIQGRINSGWGDEGWTLLAKDLKDSVRRGYDKGGVGRVLHEFETVISKSKKEVLVIFGEHGEFVAAIGGKADSVSIGNDIVKGRIGTHNHPNDAWAFSVGDVQVSVIVEMLEFRAVTPSGKYVSLAGMNERQGAFFLKRIEDTFGDNPIAIVSNDWLHENASNFGYIFTEGDI